MVLIIVSFIRFFEQTESHEGGRDDGDVEGDQEDQTHTGETEDTRFQYAYKKKRENGKRKKGKIYRIWPFGLAVVVFGFDRIGS